MSPDAEGMCWSCGNRLTAGDYQREGECPRCRKQTHVCRNCRFYEPGRPNDCQEPVAEPVNDKDRANFCDYFEPSSRAYQAGADPDALKAAADSLFRYLNDLLTRPPDISGGRVNSLSRTCGQVSARMPIQIMV